MEGHPIVLFVEDDASLRDWWCGSLEDMGYSVLSAGSAAEALVIARQAQAPFDLAVLDLGLPPHPNDPTEGLELLRLLILERPSLKVVVPAAPAPSRVASTAAPASWA